MRADFRLEDWIIRPRSDCIERGDEIVHIQPKPMAVLECLAAAGGEVITRDELFEAVWPGVIVTDDALTQCVVELRKAFGDSAHDAKIIRTIPKVGFCLVPPVMALSEPQTDSDERPGPKKTIIRTTLITIVAVMLAAVMYWYFGPPRDTVVVVPSSIPSIAVLPFADMSEGGDQEYFADGLSEELLNALAKTPKLRVIARTSSFAYKRKDVKITEVAHELNVSHILEGSVRKAGTQVRVTAQLISATDSSPMWSETYDRELTVENLFAIQSDISSRVVEALHERLSPGDESHFFDTPTWSLDAYDFYLHGRQLMVTPGTKELKQALQAFEQAVTIDPGFALAWVGIADSSFLLRYRGANYSPEAFETRKQAIEKALELDDQLGEAYLSLAQLYFEMGSRQEEEAACARSIELSPNYAEAYGWCAGLLAGQGPAYLDKRLAWYYMAAQLDPLSSARKLLIGHALRGLGRSSEAMEQYNYLLKIDPDYAPTYAAFGELHRSHGRLAMSISWYREALQRDPGNGDYMWDLAKAYLSLGEFKSITDIRKTMDAHLDPADWRFVWLDYSIKLEQGKLGELPSALDALPVEATDKWWALAWKANSYILSGDLQKAREFWLNSEPDWDDPDQWQRLISLNNHREDKLNACNYAGILMAVGKEAQGRELLSQAILFYENTLPGLVQDTYRWPGLGWCYLVAGSFEEALDFYEQRVAHGHISKWWKDEKLPWWGPIRKHPRYLAMVNNIEQKLNDQRELLHQGDKSGIVVP